MALYMNYFFQGFHTKNHKTWSKNMCNKHKPFVPDFCLLCTVFRTALQRGGQRLNPGRSSVIRELWTPLCSTYERWCHSPPSDLLCVSWRSGRAQTCSVPQWAWSQTHECFSQMLTLTPENLPFFQSSLISCPVAVSELLGRLPIEKYSRVSVVKSQ